jgi:ADP-ribose pyrophosphatase YjhB (NUDIX family)
MTNPASEPPPGGLPWTRVGAYALCVEGRRLLACRIAPSDPDAGSWTLPGGGLEFGEDPELGALRELEEETGVIGRIDGLAGLFADALPANERRGPVHSFQIIYRATPIGGELRDELDGSTDLAAWLTAAELASVSTVELLERAAALEFGAGWRDGR